jgi:hypothetical protein
MKKRNMESFDLFKLSEEFFKSIGLIQMTPDFWRYSLFEKPTDGRDLDCHASTWPRCGTDRVSSLLFLKGKRGGVSINLSRR